MPKYWGRRNKLVDLEPFLVTAVLIRIKVRLEYQKNRPVVFVVLLRLESCLSVDDNRLGVDRGARLLESGAHVINSCVQTIHGRAQVMHGRIEALVVLRHGLGLLDQLLSSIDHVCQLFVVPLRLLVHRFSLNSQVLIDHPADRGEQIILGELLGIISDSFMVLITRPLQEVQGFLHLITDSFPEGVVEGKAFEALGNLFDTVNSRHDQFDHLYRIIVGGDQLVGAPDNCFSPWLERVGIVDLHRCEDLGGMRQGLYLIFCMYCVFVDTGTSPVVKSAVMDIPIDG